MNSALWSDGVEFCPAWFIFTRPVWALVESCCEKSGPVRAGEAPHKGELASCADEKAHCVPALVIWWPSLGGTFCLASDSCGFGALPSAIPTTDHSFWLVPLAALPVTDCLHRLFQSVQTTSFSPTYLLGYCLPCPSH